MKQLFTIVLVCYSIILSASVCPDPPINDDPCPTDVNPPLDLTGVNVHLGTTCCARGVGDSNDDGTAADHPNYTCSELSAEAAVWYVFDPNPDAEGYQVLLASVGNGNDAGESIGMEVYWANEQSICEGSLFEPAGASCFGIDKVVRIGNCPGPDQKLYVKVGTSAADCGAFEITITEEVCNVSGLVADECVDVAQLIAPVTDSIFSIQYDCFEGCLDYACPEIDASGGCDQFVQGPTVWVQVATDQLAAMMFTTVSTNGSWDPVWSIYTGASCNDLQVVDVGGTTACSDEDLTPDLHQVEVLENQQYWIAITADPSSVPSFGMDDGSFEICVGTAVNTQICIGDEIGDCTDSTLVIEVIEREVENGSFDGPFCQGEEVTVHISFFYTSLGISGSEWLHGLTPKFGSGWDLDGFDFAAAAPLANGRMAEWFEEGTAIAPIIQEDIPTLCTYRDSDGRLVLCNLLCESCIECQEGGLSEGDPLPSGYYWISAGSAGCDNDGSPGESFGIGSQTAQIEWEFTLRTKIFESESICHENRDLSISFQPSSDAITGCWEDPVSECLLHRAMIGPAWQIGCSDLPPDVAAMGDTICSGEVIDISVSTVDGSIAEIVVEPLDNPLVSGASVHNYVNGSGTVNDTLVNLTSVRQVQQYSVYALDYALTCAGFRTVVSVLVDPKEVSNALSDVCDCDESGCTTFMVDQVEGATYTWSTGATTSMITVCPTSIETYSVTVSSADGCDVISSATVDCTGTSPFCMEQPELKILYSFFIDDNQDGIQDATEVFLADGSFSVVETSDLIYNVTASESDLYLEAGTYTLRYNSLHLEDWFLTTDSIVVVTLDSLNTCVSVSFGLSSQERVIDFRSYDNFLQRCNTDQTFIAYFKNIGNQEESGIFWVELDESLLNDYFFDSNTIDTFILPNRFGFPFTDLAPADRVLAALDVQVPGPPDFPVGGILTHRLYGEVFDAPEVDPIFGDKTLARPVLCSYDPNDKMVTPEHPEGYTDITDSQLSYKVRFQNTGNDVAFDIEIRDTLSDFLDISTVRYLSGSHDEYMTFSRTDEDVLIFRFDNINLPDSLSDPEGSQGYLIYNVDVQPNLPEGTVIENTAHIYFDNNPPIVTNTTKSILYDDLDNDGFYSIEDCNDEDAAINPMASEIANNDVDEDCDGELLVIDDDMDGFNSDEDCDDNDPLINPDAEEIINNDVDENCDGIAIVIDNDNDGYNSDEDCDDDNADIYPGAPEIPDNDIDEDCDGVDDMDVAVSDVNPLGVTISPNPTTGSITVLISRSSGPARYRLLDTRGVIMRTGEIGQDIVSRGEINMDQMPAGLYMLILTDDQGIHQSCHKVIRL